MHVKSAGTASVPLKKIAQPALWIVEPVRLSVAIRYVTSSKPAATARRTAESAPGCATRLVPPNAVTLVTPLWGAEHAPSIKVACQQMTMATSLQTSFWEAMESALTPAGIPRNAMTASASPLRGPKPRVPVQRNARMTETVIREVPVSPIQNPARAESVLWATPVTPRSPLCATGTQLHAWS